MSDTRFCLLRKIRRRRTCRCGAPSQLQRILAVRFSVVDFSLHSLSSSMAGGGPPIMPPRGPRVHCRAKPTRRDMVGATNRLHLPPIRRRRAYFMGVTPNAKPTAAARRPQPARRRSRQQSVPAGLQTTYATASRRRRGCAWDGWRIDRKPSGSSPAAAAAAPESKEQVVERIMKHLRERMATKRIIAPVFREMDTDRSGQLSDDEFADGCAPSGFSASRTRSSAGGRGDDADGDGNIDYTEFAQSVQRAHDVEQGSWAGGRRRGERRAGARRRRRRGGGAPAKCRLVEGGHRAGGGGGGERAAKEGARGGAGAPLGSASSTPGRGSRSARTRRRPNRFDKSGDIYTELAVAAKPEPPTTRRRPADARARRQRRRRDHLPRVRRAEFAASTSTTPARAAARAAPAATRSRWSRRRARSRRRRAGTRSPHSSVTRR